MNIFGYEITFRRAAPQPVALSTPVTLNDWFAVKGSTAYFSNRFLCRPGRVKCSLSRELDSYSFDTGQVDGATAEDAFLAAAARVNKFMI